MLALVGCLTFLVGCATTGESVRYDSTARATKSPDAVEIIESGKPQAKEYKIIGVVESDEDDLKDALPLLKAEAAKMGADAMMEPEMVSQGKSSGVVLGDNIFVKQNRKWVAKAIVWK